MGFGIEIKSEGLGVTVATQLVLILLHPWLWDHIRGSLHNNGSRLGTDGSWDDGRKLDGALLELIGELLVQEIANHENCDDSHNVENVEGRLGRNLLNGSALGMIDDWSAH